VPYFTRQVAPNGSLLVIAYVGVSQARRNALVLAGQPVPNVVQVQALIDTGASCCCVDPSVLTKLSLTPTGSSPVNTPTTGNNPAMADQYDVGISIPSSQGMPPLVHHTIPVLQAELLQSQGFHVLVGRDVLQGCFLTFDGKNGLFTLAY
jgi:hypothetical protein